MPYNKSFIDQASSVKMAEYWPRSLFKRTWPISSYLDLALGQQYIRIELIMSSIACWVECFSRNPYTPCIQNIIMLNVRKRVRIYQLFKNSIKIGKQTYRTIIICINLSTVGMR